MVAPPASTPSEPATCAQNGLSTSPPQGNLAPRIQSRKLSMRYQHQSCKLPPSPADTEVLGACSADIKTAHFHCSLDDPSLNPHVLLLHSSCRVLLEKTGWQNRLVLEECKEMFQGEPPQCWPPTRRLKMSYTVQHSSSGFHCNSSLLNVEIPQS